MRVAALCVLVGAIQLRHHKHVHLALKVNSTLGVTHGLALDPHCHHGIVNTEMTMCCMADCGECSDGSNVCKASATNGRGSTCCPAQMLAEKVPSCDNSMAPCEVPASVRAPPTQQYGDRHAKDDCNKAVPKTSEANHVATAYLKFEKKAVGASTSCGTTYGTAGQAAAACSNDDDCLGFTTSSDDTPGCLLVAGLELEELSDSSDTLYLKREDGFAGHTFKFTDPTWGACSVSCGGGVLTAIYGCETTAGVEVKLGQCTNLVAMNPDALPERKEIPCNPMECEEEGSPIGECATSLESCIRNMPSTYYATGSGWHAEWGDEYYDKKYLAKVWTVCPNVLLREGGPDRAYYQPQQITGWNYYQYYNEDGFHSKPDGTVIYKRATQYYYDWFWGMSPGDRLATSTLTFECEEGNDVGSFNLHPDFTTEMVTNTYYSPYRVYTYYVDEVHAYNPVVKHSCACAKK